MSDIGSPQNPYVENPFAGVITNVHWKNKTRELAGTCVGNVVFAIGNGGFRALVGLCNPDDGTVFAATDVTVANGDAETVSVSASGTLTASQNIGVAPWFNITADSGLAMSGIFYFNHPPGTAFDGGSISNTGDLSPYGQYIVFPGPGRWSADFTVTARAFAPSGAGFSSGFNGTISGVLTP